MTQSSRHALAGLCNVAQQFSDFEEISQLVGKDVTLLQTIEIAQRLSAGQPKLSARSTPSLPLKSIFCSLKADDQNVYENLYWSALPLAMNGEALFPKTKDALGNATTQLAKLREGFQKEANSIFRHLIKEPDNDSLLESLLLLMQRYLVPVPSSDAEDTSLYDHARMTGALTAVIAGLEDGKRQHLAQADLVKDATPVALLVGGDLSGIQDFIYTITSRGAASALRGRSFYLQLLTDAVMRYTLRELGLPMTNVVYAGGGKFYLLARAGDAKRIKDIQRHTSDVLLRHHAGDLYLSIQSVQLEAQDFFKGRMSMVWGRLNESHQAAKQRRFSELDITHLELFFTPAGQGGDDAHECQVCGAEDELIQHDEPTNTFPVGIRKCRQCASFEKIGDALRRAEWLIYEHVATTRAVDSHGAVEEVLCEFGMKAGLLRAGEWIAPSPNRRVIYVLNDGGKSNASIDVKTAIGRRYLTNVTPSVTEADIAAARKAKLKDLPKVDRVKPFDLMEMQAVGIKRLGVLMMDVDGLGAIFRDGLAERATLPRIAHLSFAINLFFEGYVAEIARTIDLETERGERLYSVYAGGDDLFFVGAWDAVIEMAQRVRAALDDYTGHHPGLHASGAIVLTGGKYPLYRAAQDLKEAEHVAKTLEWKSSDGKLRRKDALCFLGQALPWFRVGYGDVQPDGNTAAGIKELLLSVQKVSDKGLVRKLAELYTSYAEANEQRQRDGLPKQQYGPWHYRAAYTFARAARQAGASHRADVENAGEAIMADGFKGIEWVGLGARWSELASRNEVDA